MSGPLRGKRALVTGGTSGIGYYTALGLARAGVNVVLGGRDEERAQKAAAAIRKEIGSPEISYLIADMSSMDEVRQFAAEFLDRYSRLDILVNNVGGFFLTRHVSVDRYEMTFALNHLSYFLLTLLLEDLLTECSPARVVNVSSAAHYDAHIHFDDLQLQDRYWGLTAYGQSKLANVLFSNELASRLRDKGVASNALHPGFVRTGLGTKNLSPLIAPFVWLGFLGGMSPEAGAQTSLMMAMSPDLEGVTGKYYSEGKEVRPSSRSSDRPTAERLWEVSKELVTLPNQNGSAKG